MTALAPAWAVLEAALRRRRPVRLVYHGRQRIVSPHALGWKNSRPMLLGYQSGTATPPAGAAAQGWRNMFVDEVQDVVLTDAATTWQTASNYNPLEPFNSIDHLTVAITSADRREQGSRSERTS